MEMFAESDEEEGMAYTWQQQTGHGTVSPTAGDEADDAELLAAALKEDDEPEDNSVTAI